MDDRELCTSCDKPLADSGVYYSDRARVCRRCSEEMEALTRIPPKASVEMYVAWAVIAVFIFTLMYFSVR